MESILKILEARTSFNAIFQIGMDVVILVLLALVLRVKRPRMSPKDEDLVESLGKVIEETAEISRKFEANLEKRQELLQQITAKLDERIQEGRQLCARLEHLSRVENERAAIVHSSNAVPGGHTSDHQKVLALARKGLDADEIAKRIKRPVGEVELILSLRKIAS